MKDFMKVEKLGNLKIDKIIFESFYPILFTCVNEEKQLFLCVCCQVNQDGKKWLITKTTPQIILDVLTNKLTLREAFCKIKDIQYTVLLNGDKLQIIIGDENDWNYETSFMLPDKDEYLEAEEGEFDAEIAYYQEVLKSTVSNNIACTMEKIISEYINSIHVKTCYNHSSRISYDFYDSYNTEFKSRTSRLNQKEYSIKGSCIVA